MKLHVGLIYDLRDDYLAQGLAPEEVAEFDSEETVSALAGALAALGHRVERIGDGRALARRLAGGERWELVFNIAEGRFGRCREAQVPCLLEMYGIGYTFSDPLVCAATLDKAVAKRLVAYAGLPTPAFALVSRAEQLERIDLPFPLFAKPVAEGTGKGIDAYSRVDTPERLRQTVLALLERFRQPVLVEEYLPGREMTTAILGTGEQARVLGTLEFSIRPGAPAADYSYTVKEYCEQHVDYFRMPPGALRQAVEELALSAYRTLECRDAARVDIRLDRHGRPSFIEINPLPGLHPTHSDLPMIATQEGLCFTELIEAIVTGAARRLGLLPGDAHHVR